MMSAGWLCGRVDTETDTGRHLAGDRQSMTSKERGELARERQRARIAGPGDGAGQFEWLDTKTDTKRVFGEQMSSRSRDPR